MNEIVWLKRADDEGFFLDAFVYKKAWVLVNVRFDLVYTQFLDSSSGSPVVALSRNGEVPACVIIKWFLATIISDSYVSENPSAYALAGATF